MSRKLDAWIAENVMGIDLNKLCDWCETNKDKRTTWEAYYNCRCPVLDEDSLKYYSSVIKYYSSDIAAAWEVVEKLVSENSNFELCISINSSTKDDEYSSGRMSELICLSAYKHKTGKDWEDEKIQND